MQPASRLTGSAAHNIYVAAPRGVEQRGPEQRLVDEVQAVFAAHLFHLCVPPRSSSFEHHICSSENRPEKTNGSKRQRQPARACTFVISDPLSCDFVPVFWTEPHEHKTTCKAASARTTSVPGTPTRIPAREGSFCVTGATTSDMSMVSFSGDSLSVPYGRAAPPVPNIWSPSRPPSALFLRLARVPLTPGLRSSSRHARL